MNQNFFNLTDDEQREIINTVAFELNKPALVIEKDIWICWLLKHVFELPEKMAFKGGTSLSKVYGLINRFSEDVDITIDYTNFTDALDLEITSRSQIKKLSKQLKEKLSYYIIDKILPLLTKKTETEFPDKTFKLILVSNNESVEFYYPSVLNAKNGESDFNYIIEPVLLEFGVRNSTEPCKKYDITTFLSEATQGLDLPTATVDALSPIRTFWEKATLIHAECHRRRLTEKTDRLSRHWYDLSKLKSSWVGDKAIPQIDILKNVIQHKKAFYHASYTNYDDCLKQKFRLIPDGEELIKLEKDFNKMQDAQMFDVAPPPFEEIIQTLHELENNINS